MDAPMKDEVVAALRRSIEYIDAIVLAIESGDIPERHELLIYSLVGETMIVAAGYRAAQQVLESGDKP